MADSASGITDIINIPLDIREQYMPFKGNGKNFSFKTSSTKECIKFSPFPSTFDEYFDNINNDSNSVKKDDFLNNVGEFKVREYVIESRATSFYKFGSFLFEGMQKGFKEANEKTMSELVEQVKDLFSGLIKNLNDNKFYSDMLKDIIPRNYLGVDGDPAMGKYDALVIWMPFILYYCLTTSRTTRCYTFPANAELYNEESNGSAGWTSNSSSFGIESKSNGSLTGFNVFNQMLGTLNTSIMPIFNPYAQESKTTTKFKISLINDTRESAINNFLLVHNLIGGNLPLQYGFIRTGSSVYDILLPNGSRRYFMCGGKFSVKGKGVLRSLESQFGSGELPNTVEADTAMKTMEFKNIKIPDVYDLDLEFNSLLPDNFNNYIYGYFSNNNNIESLSGQSGVLNKLGNSIQTAIASMTNGTSSNASSSSSTENQYSDTKITNRTNNPGSILTTH